MAISILNHFSVVYSSFIFLWNISILSEESEVKLNILHAGVVCYCCYYKSQQWASIWVSEIMFLTKLKFDKHLQTFGEKKHS